jgi:hypothetical protein
LIVEGLSAPYRSYRSVSIKGSEAINEADNEAVNEAVNEADDCCLK